MKYNYFLQGLLLGLAYVAPIGIQNLYLINTAIRETRKRTLAVAFIIIIFDISLAVACFFGIGILINTFPVLNGLILLSGSVLVIFIGFTLIRSHPQISNDIDLESNSFLKIIGVYFALTWFNPQAIIDGTLILGGFKASLPESMSTYSVLGVCLASCLWFVSLATITLQFRTKINTHIMRWINIICGSIIIF